MSPSARHQRGILDTSAVILLPRLDDPSLLPEEPLITAVTLAELTVGPLVATLLVWGGIEFRTVILWTLIPGLLAAGSIFFLTKEREPAVVHDTAHSSPQVRRPFPRGFWMILIGLLYRGGGNP